MKITKFEHSCVLVEDGENIFLTDPGIFAWESGNVNVQNLPNIQTIIVTHKHPDHFALPFVKELIEKFPNVLWIVASDIRDELMKLGARNVTSLSNNLFEVIEGEHAIVEPFGVKVNNIIVSYKDKISITGDTHDFQVSKDILFLAVQAPWGTTVDALLLAIKLKPKYVFPVHDWMWNQNWKQYTYDRFESVLNEEGVKFLRPINGKSIDIDL